MSEWLHDPLVDRTVRIAPARSKRPTDFAAARAQGECPFCAGSEHTTPPAADRAENARGEWITRVVPNLYPVVEGDDGAHEVVIESRHHARRFIDLSEDEATAALQVGFRRLLHWRSDGRFDYVLMFKNEGRRAGASLEHVHSQIVALPEAPRQIERMWDHKAKPAGRGSELPGSELPRSGANSIWRVGSPVAPRTPFETWIFPEENTSFEESAGDPAALSDLARTLRGLLEVIDARDFNLVVQVAPLSAPAKVQGQFWLEVVPRDSSIAGFELATGAWINEVSPSDTERVIRQSFAKRR